MFFKSQWSDIGKQHAFRCRGEDDKSVHTAFPVNLTGQGALILSPLAIPHPSVHELQSPAGTPETRQKTESCDKENPILL